MSDDDMDAILFLAFRYALGRKSYITAEVSDYLLKYKAYLHDSTKRQIRSEISYAIEVGDAGMQCDIDIWEKLSAKL